VSWDLYLVPPEASPDPGAWLEAVAPADPSAGLGHAEAVRARHPELELFGPTEYGYELTSPEDSPFPIEVGLHGNHASMSVAYWDVGDRATELADTVVDIVSALRDETGWVIFDPQSDEVVDTNRLRGSFEAGHEWGVAKVAEIHAAGEPKPKRKRFFGLF
jgi:hypothetical protein